MKRFLVAVVLLVPALSLAQGVQSPYRLPPTLVATDATKGVVVPAGSKLCLNGSTCSAFVQITGFPFIALTGAPIQASSGIMGGSGTAAVILSWYLGTATLATAAIGAQTCVTQAITLSGSVAGNTCSVGAPAALEAGLIQQCVVTATGTVTLRTCNPTAGSITPAGSQTVRVLVTNI